MNLTTTCTDGPSHESTGGWRTDFQYRFFFNTAFRFGFSIYDFSILMMMMMMGNTKVCEVGTGVYEGVEDDEVAGQSVD